MSPFKAPVCRLVMMAANGLGVTLVPEMAIAAGVLSGLDLHVATLEAEKPARRVALVWRRNAGRKETLRRIAAVLRATMGSQDIRAAAAWPVGPPSVLTAVGSEHSLPIPRGRGGFR